MSERQGFHGPQTYEGIAQTGHNTQRPAWFDQGIKEIPSAGRTLLEQYSGIPSDQVLPHVLSIRDRAFDIWAYACIGQLRFLDYTLPKANFYGPVLKKLREEGGNFVDAGCCFGQVLRFLAHNDSVPAKQLYGFDLEPGFVDFGYELFRDKDRFGAAFLCGDLLADTDAKGDTDRSASRLSEIEGKMDIVHCSSVLHVWDWDQQLIAAKRLVSLARPTPGSLIVGTQMGSTDAGSYPMPTAGGTNYRHNPESMRRFWDEVGAATGTEWAVESNLSKPPVVEANRAHSWAKVDPGMSMIEFMVTRQ